MIFRSARVFVISIFLLLLTSCYGSGNFFYEGNSVDERTLEMKWISDSNDLQFEQSGVSKLGGTYTVLVLSDTHFGSKKKPVNPQKLYNWLDTKKGAPDYPSFAICLGDATELGRRDDFDLYHDFCNTLQTKYNLSLIFNACGNHDIYQNNWENWERECYPYTSFYRFQTTNFSWYCLDTASGAVGYEQYKKLMAVFELDPRPKIVFTHYPYVRFNINCSNMAETTERNLMISDFYKNKVKCLLGGHNHTATYDNLGFNDYGIPSYGYVEKWGLLYVDEAAGTAELIFCGDN